MEFILLEFQDIFRGPNSDISANRQFKAKLPPNHDRPAYSQNVLSDADTEVTIKQHLQ